MSFNHLHARVQRMSARERAIVAAACEESSTPVIRALGRDLLAFNAREDAVLATYEHEFAAEHRSRIAEIEKNLPPLPKWSDAADMSDGDPVGSDN